MAERANGTVVLSFDDRATQTWVDALPIFATYGCRATFFIDRFDELTTEQLDHLNMLRDAGHEIACHGLRHRKADEYVAEHGVDAYLADEITPAIDAMRAAGFEPTSFAYPNSRRNEETDAALLSVFKRLRTGIAKRDGVEPCDIDDFYTPRDQYAQRKVIVGKSVDDIASNVPEREKLLARAAAEGSYLALYAHSVAGPPTRLGINPAALEALLASCGQLGIGFATVSEHVA